MTQPEPQQPENAPQGAPLPEREFEAIALDGLDKENRAWSQQYVTQLRDRLTEEQAAEVPDLVMIAYLKREIATWQDLLDRTDKKS
ncbi:MAG TPA: hypothetical protein V6D47_00650 [Oscillatoriaceae cyanobacterium]